MLDEHGLGDNGTGAAGTGQSGDRRQQVQKENDQIAHRRILPRWRHQELLGKLAIRHTQGWAEARFKRRRVSSSVLEFVDRLAFCLTQNQARGFAVGVQDELRDGACRLKHGLRQRD